MCIQQYSPIFLEIKLIETVGNKFWRELPTFLSIPFFPIQHNQSKFKNHQKSLQILQIKTSTFASNSLLFSSRRRSDPKASKLGFVVLFISYEIGILETLTRSDFVSRSVSFLLSFFPCNFYFMHILSVLFARFVL